MYAVVASLNFLKLWTMLIYLKRKLLLNITYLSLIGSSLLKTNVNFVRDLGPIVQGVALLLTQNNCSVNVSEMFVE